MLQLILHLIGDYILQSGWMAENKTKESLPAFCHALVYSLPFLLIGSLPAVFVIFVTHFFIDRFRLARYVVWAKDHLAPEWTEYMEVKSVCDPDGTTKFEWTYGREKRWWHRWKDCEATGYHKDVPIWLATWLMIIADNTLHLLINYTALSTL